MTDELKAYVEDALNSDKVSLITIKNGAAIEMFDRQLARVMNNIADINQPSSNFILRLKKKDAGLTCALFEADGGAWKVAAMKSIKDFIAERMPDHTILA